MTESTPADLQPTLRARKECAAWLAECMKIGWSRIKLDALEALWWEHHDRLGNLKTEDIAAKPMTEPTPESAEAFFAALGSDHPLSTLRDEMVAVGGGAVQPNDDPTEPPKPQPASPVYIDPEEYKQLVAYRGGGPMGAIPGGRVTAEKVGRFTMALVPAALAAKAAETPSSLRACVQQVIDAPAEAFLDIDPALIEELRQHVRAAFPGHPTGGLGARL